MNGGWFSHEKEGWGKKSKEERMVMVWGCAVGMTREMDLNLYYFLCCYHFLLFIFHVILSFFFFENLISSHILAVVDMLVSPL